MVRLSTIRSLIRRMTYQAIGTLQGARLTQEGDTTTGAIRLDTCLSDQPQGPHSDRYCHSIHDKLFAMTDISHDLFTHCVQGVPK
jgi:hypothetical protein